MMATDGEGKLLVWPEAGCVQLLRGIRGEQGSKGAGGVGRGRFPGIAGGSAGGGGVVGPVMWWTIFFT